MPRRPRSASTSEASIHHVMNRGVDRRPIFFGDADRVEFGRRLAEMHERFGVTTLAYCLMDNHFHLVLRGTLADVSTAMHHFGTTFVRHTNDRIGRDGPMFRSRFVALPVADVDYLRSVVRYVHRNALDLPNVDHPAGYRWSSYRVYLGHRARPAFLDTSLVLGAFDGDIEAFTQFTENETEPIRSAESSALVSVVDRELAVERMATDPGSTTVPRRSVVLGALLDHPSLDVRNAAVDALGRPSDDALRMALVRTRRRRADDDALSRVLVRVGAALPAGRRAA